MRGLLGEWKKEKGAPAHQADEPWVDGVIELVSRVAHRLSLDGVVQCADSQLTTIVRECQETLGTGHPLAPARVDWASLKRTLMADGLLVPLGGFPGADMVFLHRTFQEYLTGIAVAAPALAQASARSADVPGAVALLADALAGHLATATWHEVVLLALGYVGVVHPRLTGVGPVVVAGAIEVVLDRAPADQRAAALALMGRVVAELGAGGVGPGCHARVTKRVRDALRGTGQQRPAAASGQGAAGASRLPDHRWGWLGILRRSRPPDRIESVADRGEDVRVAAQERAAFGDVLAKIGDTRFHGADRWHLPDDVACGFDKSPREDRLGFVAIPGGSVLMGSDRSRDPVAGEDETPQHRVKVGPFCIGRWPVTVAQFRAFVRATDYGEAGTGWERGLANHPVVRVSWVDARAYCLWLSQEFERHAKHLPPEVQRLVEGGWRIALPSEAEWERGARGDSDRVYPWVGGIDASRANYDETGIGNTSAVGCFPLGATPAYGVEELAGNVWEWTRSEWKAYPYDRDDGREDANAPRVLRGGSFNSSRRYVRSAYRYYYEPDLRLDGLGFRVVLSPFAFDL